MSTSTRTLALICGVFLAAGTMLSSMGPILPFLAERTGQDLATMSWIFTALSGGVVLTQPGFGPVSDRLGLRAVLVAGMILMGGAMLAASLTSSLAGLLVTTLLAGIGFGGVLAAGNVLVARLFANHSATALNGLNVFFGVGAILGPAVVGQAGARLGLPQAALWLGGGLILALSPLVLWLAVAPPTGQHHRKIVSGPTPHVSIWLIGLLLLIYTGTEIGFAGWVTVYIARSAGLAISEAALVASAFWLALTGGRVLGAALGMRMTARALLLTALCGLLAGAGLLALSVGGSSWLALAGVMLFGLSCGPVFPTAMALITAAARGGNSAAGLALGMGNSGGIMLPALMGMLLARYGPSAMVGMLLTCALMMLALGACALRVPAGGLKPPARFTKAAESASDRSLQRPS